MVRGELTEPAKGGSVRVQRVNFPRAKIAERTGLEPIGLLNGPGSMSGDVRKSHSVKAAC
jgi:hypothetical protein